MIAQYERLGQFEKADAIRLKVGLTTDDTLINEDPPAIYEEIWSRYQAISRWRENGGFSISRLSIDNYKKYLELSGEKMRWPCTELYVVPLLENEFLTVNAPKEDTAKNKKPKKNKKR